MCWRVVSALLVDMVFVVEMLIFKDLLKGWCWDVCFLSGYSDRGDVCVCVCVSPSGARKL